MSRQEPWRYKKPHPGDAAVKSVWIPSLCADELAAGRRLDIGLEVDGLDGCRNPSRSCWASMITSSSARAVR
jgi:hypothetical protein